MRTLPRQTLSNFAKFAILAFAAASSPAQAACIPVGALSTQTWSQSLGPAIRFNVINSFSCAAVLDRETGLVWEQNPDPSVLTWDAAINYCINRSVSSKFGWRLPTAEELGSLVQFDVSNLGNISLPLGHPFSNVNGLFWSATTSASDPGNAWLLQQPYFSFPLPPQTGPLQTGNKASTARAWCVRGGQGYNAF